MDNTTILLLLAVGGIGIWALTRDTGPSTVVVQREKKTSLLQDIVGVGERSYDALDLNFF